MTSSPLSKRMTAIFLSKGLHSGLFSVGGTLDCPSIESLRGESIGIDSKKTGSPSCWKPLFVQEASSRFASAY
jgi:hypothetical protein